MSKSTITSKSTTTSAPSRGSSAAVAGRATTAEARAVRGAITRGLKGPALDFAMAIDFDAAARWING